MPPSGNHDAAREKPGGATDTSRYPGAPAALCAALQSPIEHGHRPPVSSQMPGQQEGAGTPTEFETSKGACLRKIAPHASPLRNISPEILMSWMKIPLLHHHHEVAAQAAPVNLSSSPVRLAAGDAAWPGLLDSRPGRQRAQPQTALA